MTESEADALRARMIDVFAASQESEGPPAPEDPLEQRLRELAGYAPLYFNDFYHAFPGAKSLKRAVIALTRPILNEQLLFNEAVRDVVFELRRRLAEAEARIEELEGQGEVGRS